MQKSVTRMHATKKSVTTLAARHVGLWHTSPEPNTKFWSDLRVLSVSFRYVFITCLAQTLALPEICLLPAKDACRNVITICSRPVHKIGGIHHTYLLRLLSDKYRYIEQELLLLGIASLERIAHAMINPKGNKNLRNVQGTPKIIFSAGP